MRIVIVILALVLASVAALGGWYFYFPEPQSLREPITADMAPIDGRTGVYTDLSDNSLWLVVPALDGGFYRFPVDTWGRPLQSAQAAPDNFQRIQDQPYNIRSVAIDTPARLEAWLFEPMGGAKTGVVILHGSGNSDRANSWYAYLAHTIASAGYVAILPDKRGSGRSEGDWRNAPLSLLADDGAAWMEKLRAERPDLERYGFVGVSQGGTITPEAARKSRADFGVALSSSATPLRKQLRHEVGNDIDNSGAPGFLRPVLVSLYSLRAERRSPQFWKANGDYDLLEEWKNWRGPMAIAFGEKDEFNNVPVAESVDRLSKETGEGDELTWKVYDRVDHALTEEDGRFSETFLADFMTWLSFPEE